MKNYKQILIGILITASIIGIIDVLLVIKNMPTISETILYYTFNKRLIVAPYFMGILIGHFFIPSNLKIIKKWYFIIILLVILGFILQVTNYIISVHPMIHVLIGVICGCLFWNQNKIIEKR